MEKNKKAILIALVIGDGYIREKDSSLYIRHSIQQKELVEYKAKLLHSLLGGKFPNIYESICKSNFGTFKQLSFSKSHKYFKVLKRWLYPNKYKYLKYLTPQAIAIWYMDDGSIICNNRFSDGCCSSARTNIHTGCPTKEDAQNICDYFINIWNIKFTPYYEKGTWSIRCFHKEGKKFHELIHQYIIPSMAYKQRFYYIQEHIAPEMGDDIV